MSQSPALPLSRWNESPSQLLQSPIPHLPTLQPASQAPMSDLQNFSIGSPMPAESSEPTMLTNSSTGQPNLNDLSPLSFDEEIWPPSSSSYPPQITLSPPIHHRNLDRDSSDGRTSSDDEPMPQSPAPMSESAIAAAARKTLRSQFPNLNTSAAVHTPTLHLPSHPSRPSVCRIATVVSSGIPRHGNIPAAGFARRPSPRIQRLQDISSTLSTLSTIASMQLPLDSSATSHAVGAIAPPSTIPFGMLPMDQRPSVIDAVTIASNPLPAYSITPSTGLSRQQMAHRLAALGSSNNAFARSGLTRAQMTAQLAARSSVVNASIATDLDQVGYLSSRSSSSSQFTLLPAAALPIPSHQSMPLIPSVYVRPEDADSHLMLDDIPPHSVDERIEADRQRMVAVDEQCDLLVNNGRARWHAVIRDGISARPPCFCHSSHRCPAYQRVVDFAVITAASCCSHSSCADNYAVAQLWIHMRRAAIKWANHYSGNSSQRRRIAQQALRHLAPPLDSDHPIWHSPPPIAILSHNPPLKSAVVALERNLKDFSDAIFKAITNQRNKKSRSKLTDAQKQAQRQEQSLAHRDMVAIGAATNQRRTTDGIADRAARQRLSRQQTNHERHLVNRGGGVLLTTEEFNAALISEEYPPPVTDEVVEPVYNQAAAALRARVIACVVCDMVIDPHSDSRQWSLSELRAYRKNLTWSSSLVPLPPEITNEHDLSIKYPGSGLAGMILSPSLDCIAESKDDSQSLDSVRLHVCEPCATSLSRPRARLKNGKLEEPLPPAHALANGLAMGSLPANIREQQPTFYEFCLVSLVHARAGIAHLRGGNQKKLTGHFLAVDMDPGLVAEQLPRDPRHASFRVVVADVLTEPQKLAALPTHRVRRAMVLQLLQFFCSHHQFYITRNVKIDETVLDSLDDEKPIWEYQMRSVNESKSPSKSTPAVTVEDGSDSDVDAKENEESEDQSCLHSRHCAVVTGQSVSLTGVPPISSTGHSSSSIDPNASHRATKQVLERVVHEELRRNASNDLVLALRTGRSIVKDWDPTVDFLAMVFPELFPYGRCAFGEKRPVPLTLEHFLRILSRRSNGAFQSPDFALRAYNMVARHKSWIKAYLRLSTSDPLAFHGLTSNDLILLAEWQDDCAAATRSHRVRPALPAGLGKDAVKFSHTLRACMGAMPHTDEYAATVGRPRALSIITLNGPATFMLTLNPNDLADPKLWRFSRLVSEEEVPSVSERQNVLGTKSGAAALSFQRMIDVFFRYVLGYDFKRHTCLKSGGFFGRVISVFGAVEEQNRGSLHLHCLVWISGAVPARVLHLRQRKRAADVPHLDLPPMAAAINAYLESVVTGEINVDPKNVNVCPHAKTHDPIKVAAVTTACDHFGQIPEENLAPFRKFNDKVSPDTAKLAICKLQPDNHPLPPFAVMKVAEKAVAEQRQEAGLQPLDLSGGKRGPFNVYCYRNIPHEFAATADSNGAAAPDVDMTLDDEDARHLAEQRRKQLVFRAEHATIQLGALAHRHTFSCVKSGAGSKDSICRHHYPAVYHSGPMVELSYPNPSDPYSLPHMQWTVQRSGISVWNNRANKFLPNLTGCNSDVMILADARASFYCTNYGTKAQHEERNATRDMLSAIIRKQKSTQGFFARDCPIIDDHTTAGRVLNMAIRQCTKHSTVGGMMASYLLSGGDRYPCSERFSYCLVSTIVSILEKKPMAQEILQPLLDPPPSRTQTVSVPQSTTAAIESKMDSDDDDDMLQALAEAESMRNNDCDPIIYVDSPRQSTTPRQVEPAPEISSGDLQEPTLVIESSQVESSFNVDIPSADVADPTTDATSSSSSRRSYVAAGVSSIHDYIYRPPAYERMGMYEFSAKFYRSPISKSQTNSSAIAEKDKAAAAAKAAKRAAHRSFLAPHPLSQTHELSRFAYPAVPIILGATLPDERLLKLHASSDDEINSDCIEVRRRFGMISYILFVPFRADLIRLGSPHFNIVNRDPWSAWMQWRNQQENSIAPAVQPIDTLDKQLAPLFDYRRILSNMQDFVSGLADAKEDSLQYTQIPLGPSVSAVDGQASFSEEQLSDLEPLEDIIDAAIPLPPTPDSRVLQSLQSFGAFNDGCVPLLPAEIDSLQPVQEESDLAASKINRFDAAIQAVRQAGGDTSMVHVDENLSNITSHSVSNDVPATRVDWLSHSSSGISSEPLPSEVEKYVEGLASHSKRNLSRSQFESQVAYTQSEAFAAAEVLKHVMTRFKLNTLQRQIIVIMGMQFFKDQFRLDILPLSLNSSFDVDGSDTPQDLHPHSTSVSSFSAPEVVPPVHAFLGGAAGTGKSCVIQAIRYLFEMFQLSSSLRVCAFTGSAAISVRGTTLHSAVGLSIDSTSCAKNSDQYRQEFSTVSLMIIDEVSMIGCDLLQRLNNKLSVIKEEMEDAFGGLSILFVGDFHQLPPVLDRELISQFADPTMAAFPSRNHQSSPLVIDPVEGEENQLSPQKRSKKRFDISDGRYLWASAVQTVVILIEQMRQSGDPEYANHLTKVRNGTVDHSTLEYFNQRLVSRLKSFTLFPNVDLQAAQAASAGPLDLLSPLARQLRTFITVIVHENVDRVAVNHAVVRQICRNWKRIYSSIPEDHELRSHAYPFFTIRGSYTQALAKGEKKKPGRSSSMPLNRAIHADLLARLYRIQIASADHNLDLYIGMEVVITANINVELSIANGSRAVVSRVQLRKSCNSFHLDEQSEMRVLEVDEVACVIVRLLLPNGDLSSGHLEDGLGPGEFRVYASSENRLHSRSKKISIQGTYYLMQFPLIPAHCVTAFRVQGLTLHNGALLGVNSGPKRFLYVALSRVTSHKGLYLTSKLTDNASLDLDYNLYQDNLRLDALRKRTFRKHAGIFSYFDVVRGPQKADAPASNSASPSLASIPVIEDNVVNQPSAPSFGQTITTDDRIVTTELSKQSPRMIANSAVAPIPVPSLVAAAAPAVASSLEFLPVVSEPLPKITLEEFLSKVQTVQQRTVPVGIMNDGNTCYAGAALQCFASLSAFIQYFLVDKCPRGHRGPLTSCFMQMMHYLFNATRSSLPFQVVGFQNTLQESIRLKKEESSKLKKIYNEQEEQRLVAFAEAAKSTEQKADFAKKMKEFQSRKAASLQESEVSAPGEQADPTEFMVLLLEQLEYELPDEPFLFQSSDVSSNDVDADSPVQQQAKANLLQHCARRSVISQLLFTQKCSYSSCSHADCGESWCSQVDSMQYIMVPLQPPPDTCPDLQADPERFSAEPDNSVSLVTCLRYHLATESLDGFKCRKCSKVGGVIQSRYFSSLPPVLIISPQRSMGSQDAKGNFRLKRDTTACKYPLELDMAEFIHPHTTVNELIESHGSNLPADDLPPTYTGSTHYRLRSVVAHLSGAGTAHFVTYSKLQKGWFYFDDEESTLVNEKTVLNNGKRVYLLFYERVDQLDAINHAPGDTSSLPLVQPLMSVSPSPAPSNDEAGAVESESLPVPMELDSPEGTAVERSRLIQRDDGTSLRSKIQSLACISFRCTSISTPPTLTVESTDDFSIVDRPSAPKERPLSTLNYLEVKQRIEEMEKQFVSAPASAIPQLSTRYRAAVKYLLMWQEYTHHQLTDLWTHLNVPGDGDCAVWSVLMTLLLHPAVLADAQSLLLALQRIEFGLNNLASVPSNVQSNSSLIFPSLPSAPDIYALFKALTTYKKKAQTPLGTIPSNHIVFGTKSAVARYLSELVRCLRHHVVTACFRHQRFMAWMCNAADQGDFAKRIRELMDDSATTSFEVMKKRFFSLQEIAVLGSALGLRIVVSGGNPVDQHVISVPSDEFAVPVIPISDYLQPALIRIPWGASITIRYVAYGCVAVTAPTEYRPVSNHFIGTMMQINPSGTRNQAKIATSSTCVALYKEKLITPPRYQHHRVPLYTVIQTPLSSVPAASSCPAVSIDPRSILLAELPSAANHKSRSIRALKYFGVAGLIPYDIANVCIKMRQAFRAVMAQLSSASLHQSSQSRFLDTHPEIFPPLHANNSRWHRLSKKQLKQEQRRLENIYLATKKRRARGFAQLESDPTEAQAIQADGVNALAITRVPPPKRSFPAVLQELEHVRNLVQTGCTRRFHQECEIHDALGGSTGINQSIQMWNSSPDHEQVTQINTAKPTERRFYTNSLCMPVEVLWRAISCENLPRNINIRPQTQSDATLAESTDFHNSIRNAPPGKAELRDDQPVEINMPPPSDCTETWRYLSESEAAYRSQSPSFSPLDLLVSGDSEESPWRTAPIPAGNPLTQPAQWIATKEWLAQAREAAAQRDSRLSAQLKQETADSSRQLLQSTVKTVQQNRADAAAAAGTSDMTWTHPSLGVQSAPIAAADVVYPPSSSTAQSDTPFSFALSVQQEATEEREALARQKRQKLRKASAKVSAVAKKETAAVKKQNKSQSKDNPTKKQRTTSIDQFAVPMSSADRLALIQAPPSISIPLPSSSHKQSHSVSFSDDLEEEEEQHHRSRPGAQFIDAAAEESTRRRSQSKRKRDDVEEEEEEEDEDEEERFENENEDDQNVEEPDGDEEQNEHNNNEDEESDG